VYVAKVSVYQRRLHDVEVNPFCCMGFGRSWIDAYATLTEKTDVNPCAALGSDYVQVQVIAANPLQDR